MKFCRRSAIRSTPSSSAAASTNRSMTKFATSEAEAAIGALLALVGQHGGQIDLDAVDAVGTHALGERVAVLADAELQIGAKVVDDPGSSG